ncbi:FYVE zinc finger, partial [Cooperia oncophora]
RKWKKASSDVKPDGDDALLEDAVVQNGGSEARSAQISPNSALTCEMCQNYEVNLTMIQERRKRSAGGRLSGMLSPSRIGMKLNWSNAKGKYRLRCARLPLNVKIARERVNELVEKHKAGIEKCSEQIQDVTHVCSGFESDMKQIASKYQELLGTNRTTAAEMRAEPIDLPQSADQLQFLCLQMREELIELKSARQHEQNDMRDEIALLKEQLDEERNAKAALERDLLAQVNHLQTQLGIAASKLSSADAVVLSNESHSRQIRDLQNTVAELEAQVKQVQSERAAVELTAQNYKARCSSLQSELDTSEAVQKDFVQLSQSLQIQLEKIRQSEQEVRWQWEEDVENCSGCGTSVLKVKPRPRCLHCCKIFCSTCVQHTVPSGPNRRPANVCQVCHTLLNRDSKPFFAVDPTN